MRRVAVGVVGTGFWGENQVRVLRQSKIADLVAICDTNKKRAKEIGTKYGVAWYSDETKFLQESKIEAVTVCTPTQTHLKVGFWPLKQARIFWSRSP